MDFFVNRTSHKIKISEEVILDFAHKYYTTTMAALDEGCEYDYWWRDRILNFPLTQTAFIAVSMGSARLIASIIPIDRRQYDCIPAIELLAGTDLRRVNLYGADTTWYSDFANGTRIQTHKIYKDHKSSLSYIPIHLIYKDIDMIRQMVKL